MTRFASTLEDYARATRDVAKANEKVARGDVERVRLSGSIAEKATRKSDGRVLTAPTKTA